MQAVLNDAPLLREPVVDGMLRRGIEPWLTAWRGLPFLLRLQNRQSQELHRMRVLRPDWRHSMSLARMSLVSSLYLIDFRSFVDYSQSL